MEQSKFVLYGALTANVAIALSKFIVAAITGSSAMLSEGIHSSVDIGNGLLLLVGQSRSVRKPDAAHPFGYGKELYFWSLIVAILIFGVGGGISAYEGIIHIVQPHKMGSPAWNYIVLAIATLFEGTSFCVAVYAVAKNKGGLSFWQALRKSKDPSTFTVVAEDSAALVGIVIAACGIYFSHLFNMPVLDGAASLLIGILLAGVASLLIYKSRGLLVGTGVEESTSDEMRKMVLQDAAVAKVSLPLTMYFGPDSILLVLDVTFCNDIPAQDIASAIKRIERDIRERYPAVKRIYIEAVQD